MLKGKGEQLQMFDTATNLMKGLLGGEIGSMETDLYQDSGEGEQSANLRMMHEKLRESKSPARSEVAGSGVHDSIKEKGFQGHIRLGVPSSGDRKFIGEGHHRLAAATAIEQTGGGTQWVGLDHVPTDGMRGDWAEGKYRQRYPQNP